MKAFFKGVGRLLKTAGKVVVISFTVILIAVILVVAGLLALLF